MKKNLLLSAFFGLVLLAGIRLFPLEKIYADTPCVIDADRILCNLGNLPPGAERIIKYSVDTIATGRILNNATASTEYGDSSGSATILVKDRPSPWLVTKHPDKGTIERGEDVAYTVTITNQAPDKTYYDLHLIDDYPENTIELENIEYDPESDLDCQDDGQEIRCQIAAFNAGETRTFIAHFRAIADGTAQNTVTVDDQAGNTGGASSTIVVTEPIAQSLLLSSNCDGRKVLIGQQCVLRLLATYNYLDPEDISTNPNVTYYGYDEIGSLDAATPNLLTINSADYAQIHARYHTGHQEIESNAITINVDNGIGLGTDSDGNFISHIPLRVRKGAYETAVFDQILEKGSVPGDSSVLAKYDRLIINGYGGSGNYTWFLENATNTRIYDYASGAVCPNSHGGLECVNSSNIILESLSNKENTVALQIRDDVGNQEEITVHILPSAIKKIEIADENGTPISGTLRTPLDQNITLSARKTLWGETVSDSTGEDLDWEYSYNSEAWTSSSEAGEIGGGVLHPNKKGIFRIRAKKTQNIAYPGSTSLTQEAETVVSEPITLIVGDPVPIIDSIRTAGNLGIAEGARETLFVRMRHFGTFVDIHDIEIDLVKGNYSTLEEIPSDVQYFAITPVADEVLQSISDDKTTLLSIPFFIPILGDLNPGVHTIIFSVHNKNGQVDENIATALYPIFIGEPQKGDGNLDDVIDLRDAVIAQRVIQKTLEPDSLVLFALDYDENGKIETFDFVTVFRAFLHDFLAS